MRLLDEEGMNFPRPRTVSASQTHRQGVAQRQDARATEGTKPLVDWYRSPWTTKTLHPRYLEPEERIQIADRLRLGDSSAPSPAC